MKATPTGLPGVLCIEPDVYRDSRGEFFEAFHVRRYAELGIDLPFVQDNVSRSARHTLRGLHFQEPYGQGKLVWVTSGTVFDVVVDVRRGSPTFGRFVTQELSDANRLQLWIPPGFAHAFCVTSERADFIYKCTALYQPRTEHGVVWNDPDLGIPWPTTAPLLSPKDLALPRLKDAPLLPTYEEI
jgi:dTDP-4-dehydrorhamnose 3,5-epimerase